MLEDEMDEEIAAAMDAPLLERRIADLERQLAESEAACAGMREFISERHDILHGGLDCPGEPRCLLLLVLSSTAGADLLREVMALRELETALERIERWFGEFPVPTRTNGEIVTWEDGTPMSYGAALGSHGERDFMRALAREALSAVDAARRTAK